jgi:hypothetical protein
MNIENEGALFRGPSRGNPHEVFHAKHGWIPYPLKGHPKPISWGNEISDQEAEELQKSISARLKPA